MTICFGPSGVAGEYLHPMFDSGEDKIKNKYSGILIPSHEFHDCST